MAVYCLITLMWQGVPTVSLSALRNYLNNGFLFVKRLIRKRKCKHNETNISLVHATVGLYSL